MKQLIWANKLTRSITKNSSLGESSSPTSMIIVKLRSVTKKLRKFRRRGKRSRKSAKAVLPLMRKVLIRLPHWSRKRSREDSRNFLSFVQLIRLTSQRSNCNFLRICMMAFLGYQAKKLCTLLTSSSLQEKTLSWEAFQQLLPETQRDTLVSQEKLFNKFSIVWKMSSNLRR